MTKDEREKILRYYRATGDGDLAARLLDLAQTAVSGRRYRVGDFLDRHQAMVAETIAQHDRQRLELRWAGGYDQAERRRPLWVAAGYRGAVDDLVTAVAVDWDERFYNIDHRDLLGSLTGLGIDRGRLGDIVPGRQQYRAAVVCCAEILPLVLAEWRQAGAAQLTVRELSLSAIEQPEPQSREIRATVAALRIDAVCAAGFGISRSRAAEELAAGRYQINWQPVRAPSQPVRPDDVISCRGRGRLVVGAVNGQTKKGRISLTLLRCR
ncbi:MAG: YlmH/Sll1252 family protein [Negativicutes bacterium]|nr:YlmH/Sll1252 family protein [Negativicutes bacterium]